MPRIRLSNILLNLQERYDIGESIDATLGADNIHLVFKNNNGEEININSIELFGNNIKYERID